jgi:nucleotide-binding universal stress UspA family protein
MLNLSTILLPVDFSERSIAAARYAGALACRFQSQVIMVHVLPNEYPIGAFEAPIDFHNLWNDRLEEAQKNLDAFLADDFRRMPVKRFVLDGDPATRIVQVAGCEGAKLIVMPTHGYGPFRRFILGSVTAKVLHDADCTVLTSAHIEDAPPPESLAFRNILCAVDLGPQSRAALAWAVEFAAKYESRLHVVHVLPSLEAGQARYFDAEFQAALQRSAKEEVLALLESSGRGADVLIEHGAVAQSVRAAAECVKADCVVIGRHASSGLLGRLHADAYAIVRESPCPVVSV